VQSPLESIHPQARKAGEASLCAARQGIEFFWSIHDRLFAGTGDWSGLGTATDVFKGYASELGLDLARFSACLEAGETTAELNTQIQYAYTNGVSGVPYFLVNDWPVSGAQAYSVFQSAIEKALAGEHPPPTPTPLPEGKSWLDVNPDKPGYTYGGDAYRGEETAQVVVFQFIDFASADNRTVVVETWPELEKQYLESGKVRLVIKHLPLASQPTAVLASEVAECAGQQNAFWPMYGLLFQSQSEWSSLEDATAVFKRFASELKLNDAAFAACLQDDEARAKVESDMDIGVQNGFPAAPVFFIFKGDEGGYVQTDQLRTAIDEFLTE
jgi:protein-disulfide isomerase